MKTPAAITVSKTTVVKFLISLRLGHATLRNSALTSRKYFFVRAQGVGFTFFAPVAKDFTSFINPSGFLCELYEFCK
mgnify:CR=1 FL=1